MSARRYHFNPETGHVGICRAQHQCRFGGVPHFESKTAAQKGYEQFVNKPAIMSLKAVYPGPRPLLSSALDLSQLKSMIDRGFISMNSHPDDKTLRVLCYRNTVTMAGMWNESTKIARGLIIRSEKDDFSDAVIIERPWRKFFTLQQHQSGWTLGDDEEGSEKTAADDLSKLDFNSPVEVTDKADGSLGVLYRAPDGKVAFSTKGSFDSDQAQYYTRFVRGNEKLSNALEELKSRYPNVTFLFELTGPNNQIVLRYPKDDTVFLGAVDVETGRYLSTSDFDELWADKGLTKAESFKAANVTEALALPEREDKEGVVIRVVSDDPERQMQLKVKQEEYLKLHRLATGISRRTIDEIFRNSSATFGDLRKVATEENIELIEDISRSLEPLREMNSSFIKNVYEKNHSVMSRALLPKVKELESAYTVFESIDDELFDRPQNELMGTILPIIKSRSKSEQNILFSMVKARLDGKPIDEISGRKLMAAASKNVRMVESTE